MADVLTTEVVFGMVTLFGTIATIIWRITKFITNYVDKTTADLRKNLTTANTDREVLRGELAQERLTRQRLEDKVRLLANDLARIEGRAEERELVMGKMGAELREAHENNGKLKHANETAVKESKKVAESKDKLITKITRERDKLAGELETVKKDLQRAMADQAKLEAENKRLKAEVAAKKKADESGDK